MVAEDYLSRVRKAFSEANFVISEAVSFRQKEFVLVASKIRFDFVGVPTYLEEAFHFCECDGANAEAITSYCSEGWAYASSHPNPRPWLSNFLGVNLCSYTIALCPHVSPAVAKALQESTPPNHFGEGWEVPLAYDATEQKLYCYQRVPWLGGAFYGEMKKVIKKRLDQYCRAT